MRETLSMKNLAFVMIITVLFYFLMKTSLALDTIVPNQTLHDNGSTLVSSNEDFELGFFSPGNSKNRYVGIWFKNIPVRTVVWVANRDKPLTDFSGSLTVTSTGNIVILNNQSTIPVWSSNSSIRVSNPISQLLDTGNLVVKDGKENKENNITWQSFDHPCDTLISGMKLGMLETGENSVLRSWRTLQDPSTGDYSCEFEANDLPQFKVRNRYGLIESRSVSSDSDQFGDTTRILSLIFPNFLNNYYAFTDIDKCTTRLLLNQSGLIQHYFWNNSEKEWVNMYSHQRDECDTYAYCGPNGLCDPNAQPACTCLQEFTPINKKNWDARHWQEGCRKKSQLNCSEAADFKKYSVKWPDNAHILKNNSGLDLEACKDYCLGNCSCLAYARTNRGDCVVWSGDLLDIKKYSRLGQEIYIKVASSKLAASSKLESKNTNKRIVIIVSVSSISGTLLLALISYFVLRKIRAPKTRQADGQSDLWRDSLPDTGEDLDLPIFNLETIASATNNFSSTNKIGEGGFGSVYKGVLCAGQEIAVKRLSKESGQGLEEFKNEVILISKLQHRNLVRLLGCCIHREERMLIYEYMPNRSLDSYIFDQKEGTLLDWKKRFEIIVGIARGLLYLHHDSRLRIIHRDLKAGNILLDNHMDPKISDFGIARIFGGDQTEANTLRIMGTYGYMSPEYAIDGLFSTKSDVFSFGVLVLEIISGRKNRGFCHPGHDLNLLGHAWNLWNEGRPMELIDNNVGEPVPILEVLRCIQVGLLCVQQRPEDRPTMSYVLLMLTSENPVLSQPKQSGYYTEKFFTERDSSSIGTTSYTSNEVTLTAPYGR